MSMRLTERAYCPWACALATATLILTACAAVLAQSLNAQSLNLTMEVLPDSNRVIVEGRCPPVSRWNFRDSYAGILGLGQRIERFSASDDGEPEIATNRIAPGQYESTRPATHFKYQVNLTVPANAADSAKVSWLGKERGLLILADLLPLFPANDVHEVGAVVKFKQPDAWAVYSSTEPRSTGEFALADVASTVFAVGKQLRNSRVTESGLAFDLVAAGEWAFADHEVLDLTMQILSAHKGVFGAMPAKRGLLILFPFPQTAGAREWSAETRGATVTLLMGRLPSKVAALAQLSTPLTHELFHLWVPNALALNGDYDWFYEGFTMYQAARVAVRLNLLTFQEFLDALARAYDSYLNDPARDRWSLVEASKRRWTGGSASVYAKSMSLALLLDLKMREAGRNHGLDDIYRKLFADYQLPTLVGKDGNDAIIGLLTAGIVQMPAAMTITAAGQVDLAKELAPYGLTVEKFGTRTRISVAERLTKRQRDLLRELGYNAAGHSAR